MSNDQPNVPGIDNLTPFEYALAGVPAPDGQDAPSLAVIKEMRALAKEVEETPITQRRLLEFLESGGAKRNDRRSARTRRSQTAISPRRGASGAPVEGGFIDITPIEIVQDETADLPAAPLAAKADVPAGSAFAETGEIASPIDGAEAPHPEAPRSEAPGSDGADFEAPNPDGSDSEGPGAPRIGDLSEAVAGAAAGAGIAAAANAEFGLDDPTSEMITPGTAPLDNGDQELLTAFDAPPSPLAEFEPPSGGDDQQQDLDLTVMATPVEEEPRLLLDDGTTVSMSAGRASQGPVEDASALPSRVDPSELDRLFPEVEDDPDFRTGAGFDHVRPHPPELASAPLLTGNDHLSDDGAILVTAGGGEAAGILDDDDGVPRGPIGAAASMTPVPIQRRRLGGGALWTLVGTAVGVAVLGLGALLWANGLRDDGGSATETAAEAITTTTAIDDSQPSTVAPPSTEDQPTSTEDTQAQDSRSSGSGDFDSSTTLEPTTTAEPEISETTATQTTEQVTTTAEPETTEAPTTEAPTTETPTTTPPETDPPLTTSPSSAVTESTLAGPLAFIGDSVNIGAFSGPPAPGALVALFNDGNGDGRADALNQTRTTDGNGRYAFNVEPGCYVVRFYPIASHTVDPDLEFQPLCVERGQAAARVDGILYPIQVEIAAPPSGCLVEPRGGERQGVEVYEYNSDWAQSYTFYAGDGSVVVRTADLGPPNDIDSPTDHEWMAAPYGFDHRAVRRVAAERNGVLSEQITCSR